MSTTNETEQSTDEQVDTQPDVTHVTGQVPEEGAPVSEDGEPTEEQGQADTGDGQVAEDEAGPAPQIEQTGSEEDRPATASAAGTRSTGTAAEDLVREGEVAADFLETLLDIADLDGDLEVDVDGDRAAVALVDSEDGAAPRRLVGPGGSVLEALQELTRLAVQAETGERSRLMLDVAGYRADRRSTLVSQAQKAIAEVKESGERRELEPMSAFERKVVHDEVLAAGLSSESEGTDPSRYVVILPAD